MLGHPPLALLLLATGLRVQALAVSPSEITTSTVTWTNLPQNVTGSPTPTSNNTQNNSTLTVISPETTSLPKNITVTSRAPENTSKVSTLESTVTAESPGDKGITPNQSSPITLPTSSQDQSITTLGGLSSATPEVSNDTETLSTASPPASDMETVTSQPSVSSSSPFWLSSKVSPTDVVTDSITAKNKTHQDSSEGPLGTPTVPNETPTFPTSSGSSKKETTSPMTIVEMTDSNTVSPRIIMEEVENALSSGSIVAITVTVIAVVLLVFGVAAYLKIRHSSYGRLLDDHDYGSWGNYNNPLYDDS